MVEELLKRKCDPNQSFESFGAHGIRDQGLRTVWEAVLLRIYERFQDVELYAYDLGQNQKAMHDLRLRWLKTIKLFLDYGADPAQFVIEYGYTGSRRWRRRYPKSRISGLFIFNRVFTDFDDPMVLSVRDCMVFKGATEVEEDILIPDPIPDPKPTRVEKSKESANKQKRNCIRS